MVLCINSVVIAVTTVNLFGEKAISISTLLGENQGISLTELGSASRQTRALFETSGRNVDTQTAESRAALVKVGAVCDDVDRLARSLQAITDLIDLVGGTIPELLNSHQTIDSLNAAIADFSHLVKDIRHSPCRYVKISIF